VAETIHCTLVTPDARLLDEQVVYASVPAWDGQVGIAPGRAPLLAKLGAGALRLDFADGASRSFFVQGGFVQMVGSELTLLSDKAAPAEDLVASDAAKELAAVHQQKAAGDTEIEARLATEHAAREKVRLAQMVQRKGI